MSNDIEQFSYGIIPLSKLNGLEWNVLLIQHKADGYWGFPKGKAESNEMPKETAIRELFEETHLEVVRFISEKSFDEQYRFMWRGQHIHKYVSFYIAEVKGDVALQEAEVIASQWVPLISAHSYLTFDSAKQICSTALKLISTE